MQTKEFSPTLEPATAADSGAQEPVTSTNESAPALQIASLDELFPVIHLLTRHDKLRLLQFVVAEIVVDDQVTQPNAATPISQKAEMLNPNVEYPIWSQYDAPEAAHVLMETLEHYKEKPNG